MWGEGCSTHARCLDLVGRGDFSRARRTPALDGSTLCVDEDVVVNTAASGGALS